MSEDVRNSKIQFKPETDNLSVIAWCDVFDL